MALDPFDLQLIADLNLKIRHFNYGHKKRGCTIVYRLNGDLMDVAFAWKHPRDPYIKTVGIETALYKIRLGNIVKLPANIEVLSAFLDVIINWDDDESCSCTGNYSDGLQATYTRAFH